MDTTFADYELRFGDGTFDDVALWAQFLNITTDAEFESQIEQKLNADYFVRTMVVETAISFRQILHYQTLIWGT